MSKRASVIQFENGYVVTLDTGEGASMQTPFGAMYSVPPRNLIAKSLEEAWMILRDFLVEPVPEGFR